MRYAVSGHPLPDFVAIAISLSSHSGQLHIPDDPLARSTAIDAVLDAIEGRRGRRVTASATPALRHGATNPESEESSVRAAGR
jgi:hypothetical protein